MRMTALSIETKTALANPIDLVEEIVQANEWAHDRASDEEMVIEIAGRWCDYRLLFVWQREMNALHYSCGFEMKVPRGRRAAIFELLAAINERLWIGHFDLAADDASPSFRQGVLLRGAFGPSAEQIEDLVDISVSECERFFPAFQLVVWAGKNAKEAIASAMIDPVGEA
jgi:hypothetical protein